MDPKTNPLAEAMKRLWATHLPELEARVNALATCAQVLRSDMDPSVALHDASAAAHKLAGVLGTFGLQQGTEIARKAEVACGSFNGDKSAMARTLEAIANELNELLASKT